MLKFLMQNEVTYLKRVKFENNLLIGGHILFFIIYTRTL